MFTFDSTFGIESFNGKPKASVFWSAKRTGATRGVVFSSAAATGVRMIRRAGIGNQITENSFVENSVIGIDFANPGPTTNDVDDADKGANRRQNHPVLESAVINATNLNVTFSVPTAIANATYDLNIEVYKSDANGQGQQYLGTVLCTAANALQFAAQVDEVFAADDEESLLSKADMLF